jgi:hypothetical protein
MMKQVLGPHLYENLIAQLSGKPVLTTDEYSLFSDAHVIGDSPGTPYSLLNVVGIPEPGLVRAAIVLRCDNHIEWTTPDMEKTDVERYHGGSFPEEAAALASLSMGIRLKAGALTRTFRPGDDPKGRPMHWDRQPIASITLEHGRKLRLPDAARGTLEHLNALQTLPLLPPDAASVLVRAARMYQDAIWIAESQPELAWLLLVSALETAANQWKKSKSSPVEIVKVAKPALYEHLSKFGQDILGTVSEHIAGPMQSTKKFLDFVMQFIPCAPVQRPPVWCQCSWEPEHMLSVLTQIYDYRSKALHQGIPFPAPMCEIPYTQDWEVPAERSLGLASSVRGGVWVANDTPMLLHVFEYITRNVLQKWAEQSVDRVRHF